MTLVMLARERGLIDLREMREAFRRKGERWIGISLVKYRYNREEEKVLMDSTSPLHSKYECGASLRCRRHFSRVSREEKILQI